MAVADEEENHGSSSVKGRRGEEGCGRGKLQPWIRVFHANNSGKGTATVPYGGVTVEVTGE